MAQTLKEEMLVSLLTGTDQETAQIIEYKFGAGLSRQDG